MLVYKREKEDGLADLITNSGVAYIMPFNTGREDIAKAPPTYFPAKSSIEDFDLFSMWSILASTGWNKNDDVFDKLEIVLAKDTPIHKPFNLGHDSSRIIGHITGTKILDADYNILDGVDYEDLPDTIHIATSSVIYRYYANQDGTNEELTAEVAQIIEQIQKGEWYISMEVLFPRFDYALAYATGENKIVERNEKTAFLTKYLRRFGGTGSYNGARVGRVLRNLCFSGKALVRNPANVESIIFSEENLSGVFTSIATEYNFGEINMNEEEIKAMQDQNAEYAVAVEQYKQTLTEKESLITELNAKVDELGKVNTELLAAKAVVEAQVVDVQGQFETAQATIVKIESELNALRTQVKRDSRLAQLVNKGVDSAKATTLVDSFIDMPDDKFNIIGELVSAASVEKVTPSVADAPVLPEDEPAPELSQANVDDTVPNDDVNLGVSLNDDVADVMKSVAEYMSQSLNKNK